MKENPRLGYIGLGNQGAPMAHRYLSWPGGLSVFDVRAEAMAPLIEGGASAATSVADIAAAADVISVTVLTDEQVRDVIAELAAHARPGTVVAIHSTIGETTAAELAVAVAPQGIHIVDAPVSGGAAAAARGELAVMVGAAREVYQRIKPIFAQWASLIVHAGEPGAGTRMKLARNMLTFTYYAAACEAMTLAEAAGLDLQALGRVVRHTESSTGAGNIMIRDTMAPLPADHILYQPFSHARDLGEKDLGLALDLATALDLDLPLARIASETLAAGMGVPHPDNPDRQDQVQ